VLLLYKRSNIRFDAYTWSHALINTPHSHTKQIVSTDTVSAFAHPFEPARGAFRYTDYRCSSTFVDYFKGPQGGKADPFAEHKSAHIVVVGDSNDVSLCVVYGKVCLCL
jgi:hypothetical protein